MQPRRILLVADERTSERLRSTLDELGVVIAVKGSCDRAYKEVLESQYDLVVVNLEDAEATSFIKDVRGTPKLDGTVVLAIGDWGTGQPTLALSHGADAYEPTPIEASRLIERVDRLLNKRAAVAGMNE